MLVCECGKRFSCERNGITVRFKETDSMIQADLYKCSGCGHRVLTGFAENYLPPGAKVEPENLIEV